MKICSYCNCNVRVILQHRGLINILFDRLKLKKHNINFINNYSISPFVRQAAIRIEEKKEEQIDMNDDNSMSINFLIPLILKLTQYLNKESNNDIDIDINYRLLWYYKMIQSGIIDQMFKDINLLLFQCVVLRKI